MQEQNGALAATPAPGALAADVTVESAIDHAKRAFALKKYEQAVDHYATALELMYVPLLASHARPYPHPSAAQDEAAHGGRAGDGRPVLCIREGAP